MHVPIVVHDIKKGCTRHVINDVWNYVVENHSKWRTKQIMPLFITHRDMQEDTSLIVRADNPDAIANFIETHITQIPNLRSIWVLNMAKIKIFRLPDDRPRDLIRFTITIDALPKFMGSIYDHVSALRPSDEIIVTYVTETYQSFRASIMVSVLARSRNHIEAFVKDHIRSLPGVEDADITYISKTLRLVSQQEWLEEVEPFLVVPGSEPMKSLEVDDDSLFSAC